MSIEVIGFRILVKPDNVMESKKYKTDIPGFVVAGQEKDREQQAVDKGVVVSLGPVAFEDYKFENPLKVGDHIVFAKFAGKEVTDPETEEKFVVILDEDVVAILRGAKE
jgi:co-chaperonin GroES (HSP10)